MLFYSPFDNGREIYPVLPYLLFDAVKRELKDEAQAEVVVAVVRRVVVTVRHATVPGVVVPAAATVHAVGAITDIFLVFVMFYI